MHADEIRSEEIEGMQIDAALSTFFAVFWLIPLTMAYLSLTLKGSANRWANIIVGIVLAGFYTIDMSGHLI